MNDLLRKSTTTVGKWAVVLAVVATAGSASISAGRADETQAKSLLKAMSDYLAAQKAISFDYDSNLEIVSTQQQKIALASSGTLTLNRPDKLHATRTGGFANIEMVFAFLPRSDSVFPLLPLYALDRPFRAPPVSLEAARLEMAR